jgi:hypothetical protein
MAAATRRSDLGLCFGWALCTPTLDAAHGNRECDQEAKGSADPRGKSSGDGVEAHESSFV